MSISWIFRVLYLFLLWVPLFGENQEPDAYTRRVVALQIEEDLQNQLVSGVITLDNGSRWIWNPCHCCCRKLDDWEIGDEIRILNAVNGKYSLYNNKHVKYQPSVEIESISIGCFPIIESINESGQLLSLSDGSRWHLGWWSALWANHWKLGDPVIITRDQPTYGHSTHLIFNMNREKTVFNDSSFINATLEQ